MEAKPSQPCRDTSWRRKLRCGDCPKSEGQWADVCLTANNEVPCKNRGHRCCPGLHCGCAFYPTAKGAAQPSREGLPGCHKDLCALSAEWAREEGLAINQDGVVAMAVRR